MEFIKSFDVAPYQPWASLVTGVLSVLFFRLARKMKP